jgi:hypothetical protein
MADDSSDRPPHYPNLRPIRQGEVRNPHGRNGREAQAAIAMAYKPPFAPRNYTPTPQAGKVLPVSGFS